MPANPEAFAQVSEPRTDIGPGIVGPDIASAATIAPTHKIHVVTGAVAIVNITVPYPGFAGIIYLIAGTGSAFTWTAAGNIAIASAAAPSAGKWVGMLYNPVTNKWYPQSTVAA